MQHGERIADNWELPRGRAYGSLALGMFAVLFGPVLLGAIPGITGIVLGVRQIRHGQAARKVAYAGTGLSVIGTLLSLTPVVLFCVFVLPSMTPVTTAKMPSPLAEAAAALSPAEKQQWSAYPPDNQVALAAAAKWIGVQSPVLTLRDDSGNEEHLSDYLGKKVLIACVELDFFGSTEEFPFGLLAKLSATAVNAKVFGVFYPDQEYRKREPCSQYGFALRSVFDNNLDNAYAVDAAPVFFVIDRKGVIQQVFGGKEPEEQIIAALGSEDYPNEPRQAPVAASKNKESPLAGAELVKCWEVKTYASSDVARQFPGTAPESETLIFDGKGCTVVDTDRGTQTNHQWPEEYFSINAVAMCKLAGKRRVAVWACEHEQFPRKDHIQVFDENWQPLWTQDVHASGEHSLAWVDLDKKGTPGLLVCPAMHYAEFYSAEGKLEWEWGQAPKSDRDGTDKTAKKVKNRGKGSGITPLGLFENEKLGRVLVGEVSRNDVCFARPGGKLLDTLHIECEISADPRVVAVCDSGATHQVLMGVIRTHGPREKDYLSVLDQDGQVLWTRNIEKTPFSQSNAISAMDCFGDAAKEWLVMGNNALQVISHDGKLLYSVAVPTTPGISFEKDKNGKDLFVPVDMPPEKMRIIPRSGKRSLLLILSDNWIAYELKLTVQN